ncbi:glycosyltransferase family 4 protein [Blastococcus brunescens]|uniref:Glycosyltransferase family 4 protein n=1 Tax=Blastococcus brunescens TaxID=1564165 RepID=A0ABZ1B843_9ACTN|nr:glycosyltransferase family 4 protein [Blastococcus sp. BMG 8361]WRL66956.1 glycosyltransferase family 4 protein [Blastococcus sp. BMG 8361]
MLEALRTVVREHPGARLLIAGRGDADDLWQLVGNDLRPHITLLGEVSETDKAAFLRSVDVYCAPNLLGESFGVILIEALAAGAPIVASDLDAFARVLEDGVAGVLVRRGDAAALGRALCDLLADPDRLAALSTGGPGAAAAYDWQVLARRILAVYEMVVPPDGGVVLAAEDDDFPGCRPHASRCGRPYGDGRPASLMPRDARRLVAARRRPRAVPDRLGGLDAQPAQPARGPGGPRVDRAGHAAATAGRARRGAGPHLPRRRGEDRAAYLAAFAVDARNPSTATGSCRRTPWAGSCASCRPTCPGCPRRCRPTWRAPPRAWDWPAASTTTRCATPVRCAVSGCPGCSVCTPAVRCPATSTSTTDWSRSPVPGSTAPDPP